MGSERAALQPFPPLSHCAMWTSLSTSERQSARQHGSPHLTALLKFNVLLHFLRCVAPDCPNAAQWLQWSFSLFKLTRDWGVWGLGRPHGEPSLSKEKAPEVPEASGQALRTLHRRHRLAGFSPEPQSPRRPLVGPCFGHQGTLGCWRIPVGHFPRLSFIAH